MRLRAKHRRPASRIVSLTPTTTEILFALGVGRQVVGVSAACDHPPRAAAAVRVGPVFRPDEGLIDALGPDLILAQGEHFQKLVSPWRQDGRWLEVIDPGSVAEIWVAFRKIGRLVGAEDQAEELVGRVTAEVGAVQERLKGLPDQDRPLTVRLLEARPAVIAGPKSFMADVIRLAGGRNLELKDQRAYPTLSPEQVAALDPEVVYVCGWDEDQVAELKGLPGWRATRAVNSSQVAILPCGLACRPGPRVGQLVENLARVLHPRRFY